MGTQKTRKILTLLLVAILAVGVIPTSVAAATPKQQLTVKVIDDAQSWKALKTNITDAKQSTNPYDILNVALYNKMTLKNLTKYLNADTKFVNLTWKKVVETEYTMSKATEQKLATALANQWNKANPKLKVAVKVTGFKKVTGGYQVTFLIRSTNFSKLKWIKAGTKAQILPDTERYLTPDASTSSYGSTGVGRVTVKVISVVFLDKNGKRLPFKNNIPEKTVEVWYHVKYGSDSVSTYVLGKGITAKKIPPIVINE